MATFALAVLIMALFMTALALQTICKGGRHECNCRRAERVLEQHRRLHGGGPHPDRSPDGPPKLHTIQRRV